MGECAASTPLTLDRPEPDAVMRGLTQAGAVLIRGDATRQDYLRLGDAIVHGMRHHATGSHERDLIDAEANVSTVNKGSDAIPLHREASYLPDKPDMLMFYCERPPRSGGQTTLCDGVELLRAMPGPVREELQNGDSSALVWDWDLPRQRWSVAFGTDSVYDAEGRIAALRRDLPEGEDLQTRFDGDQLHGRYRTRAVSRTRFGGQPALCNSVLAYYDRDPGPYVAMHMYRLTRGDGTAFPARMLSAIRDGAERLIYQVAWRAGDIVCVDNSRFMHGRRPITDPERRILVRLGRYRAA
jgi:hypothetical protein